MYFVISEQYTNGPWSNSYTKVSSHRSLMVENGILKLVFQEVKHRSSRIKIKREIGHILGNLALEETTLPGMVNEGS